MAALLGEGVGGRYQKTQLVLVQQAARIEFGAKNENTCSSIYT